MSKTLRNPRRNAQCFVIDLRDSLRVIAGNLVVLSPAQNLLDCLVGPHVVFSVKEVSEFSTRNVLALAYCAAQSSEKEFDKDTTPERQKGKAKQW